MITASSPPTVEAEALMDAGASAARVTTAVIASAAAAVNDTKKVNIHGYYEDMHHCKKYIKLYL